MRSSLFSRRKLLLLAGTAAYIKAAEKDFWNTKPPSEWDTGEIYTLMNNSPWARTARWWGPKTRQENGIVRGQVGGMPLVGPKAVITWESARPLRDAMKTPSAPVYANFYVIGVDTIPNGDDYAGHLENYAHLRCTGRSKWSARAFGAHNLIRTSSIYEFSFPRTSTPIGLDTEEVVFEIDLESWTIQSRFKTKDMVYRGQLAI
jgi:hypothetical protein